MSLSPSEELAEDRGFDAYNQGFDFDINPYHKECSERLAWEMGYIIARSLWAEACGHFDTDGEWIDDGRPFLEPTRDNPRAWFCVRHDGNVVGENS
jgi:hypothetical protein